MVSKFELSPHVAKCGRRPRPKFANVLTIDAMCDCAQCCMHALFLKTCMQSPWQRQRQRQRLVSMRYIREIRAVHEYWNENSYTLNYSCMVRASSTGEQERNKQKYCTLRSTHYCKQRNSFDVIYQTRDLSPNASICAPNGSRRLHFLALWPSLLSIVSTIDLTIDSRRRTVL